VAVLHYINVVQVFLHPYVQKYEAAREAVAEWWAVREERSVAGPACLKLYQVHVPACLKLYQVDVTPNRKSFLLVSDQHLCLAPAGIGSSLEMRQKDSGSGSDGMRRRLPSGQQLSRVFLVSIPMYIRIW
jgi:hypothetical protein